MGHHTVLVSVAQWPDHRGIRRLRYSNDQDLTADLIDVH